MLAEHHDEAEYVGEDHLKPEFFHLGLGESIRAAVVEGRVLLFSFHFARIASPVDVDHKGQRHRELDCLRTQNRAET